MTSPLLIDGTEFPPHGTVEWPADWLFQGVAERGEAVTFPGYDGGMLGDRPYEPSILPVPFTIHNDGASEGLGIDAALSAANARFRDVRQACKPGQTVTLTRRLAFGGASEDHTCAARFVGMNAARLSADATRAVAEFILLDGVWYGPAATVSTGSATILGDTRTYRMQITLAGATGQVLTNQSNGWSLTYAGASGTGVVIDVEAMTVSGGSAADLRWNRRLPFRLDPGANTLTVSAGTASISYSPAYL